MTNNKTNATKKKLTLHREQLRVLASGQLERIAGGAPPPPTTSPLTCPTG